MKHHSVFPNNQKLPVRGNIVPATDWSVEIQSHPRRIQGLARSLTRKQEQFRRMRQEAIAIVNKAIVVLDSIDLSSMPPAAEQLLSELEGALDELNALEIEVLPRPEDLFAIVYRLNQLNEKLQDQSNFQ